MKPEEFEEVELNLDEDVYKILEEQAQKRGIPINDLVVEILTKMVEEKENADSVRKK